jgi:hypothetical protein
VGKGSLGSVELELLHLVSHLLPPFIPTTQSRLTTRACSRQTDSPDLFLGVAICPFSTAAAIRGGEGRKGRGSSLGSCFVSSSRVLVVRSNEDGGWLVVKRESWAVREKRRFGDGDRCWRKREDERDELREAPSLLLRRVPDLFPTSKISRDRLCWTSHAWNKGWSRKMD